MIQQCVLLWSFSLLKIKHQCYAIVKILDYINSYFVISLSIWLSLQRHKWTKDYKAWSEWRQNVFWQGKIYFFFYRLCCFNLWNSYFSLQGICFFPLRYVRGSAVLMLTYGRSQWRDFFSHFLLQNE